MRRAIATTSVREERYRGELMYLVAVSHLYGTEHHPWYWTFDPERATLFDKVRLDEFFANLRTDGPVGNGLDYIKLVLYPGPDWQVRFVTEKEIEDATTKKEVDPYDKPSLDGYASERAAIAEYGGG